jgi:hypothetical protein
MFYRIMLLRNKEASIRKISWSWADILILDLADGSHDDGQSGESMEVLNILKRI